VKRRGKENHGKRGFHLKPSKIRINGGKGVSKASYPPKVRSRQAGEKGSELEIQTSQARIGGVTSALLTGWKRK